jgi:hypothetical protein
MVVRWGIADSHDFWRGEAAAQHHVIQVFWSNKDIMIGVALAGLEGRQALWKDGDRSLPSTKD